MLLFSGKRKFTLALMVLLGACKSYDASRSAGFTPQVAPEILQDLRAPFQFKDTYRLAGAETNHCIKMWAYALYTEQVVETFRFHQLDFNTMYAAYIQEIESGISSGPWRQHKLFRSTAAAREILTPRMEMRFATESDASPWVEYEFATKQNPLLAKNYYILFQKGFFQSEPSSSESDLFGNFPSDICGFAPALDDLIHFKQFLEEVVQTKDPLVRRQKEQEGFVKLGHSQFMIATPYAQASQEYMFSFGSASEEVVNVRTHYFEGISPPKPMVHPIKKGDLVAMASLVQKIESENESEKEMRLNTAYADALKPYIFSLEDVKAHQSHMPHQHPALFARCLNHCEAYVNWLQQQANNGIEVTLRDVRFSR